MNQKNQKKVVSANYKDRTSKFPWLIRDENEDIEDTKEFKVIKATNVTFSRSNIREKGFGCSLVAFCETAEGFNKKQEFDLTSLTRLAFDGLWNFKIAGTGQVIEKVSELYLTENGKMYAQVEALVPAEVE